MSGATYHSRAAIVSAQLRQLHELIRAVLSTNSFHQKKYAGLDLAEIKTLDDLSKIPFAIKGEIAEDQRRHPPYGTNLTFPLEQYTRCHQTSGTAGLPLRWLDTPQSWNWMIENWKEVFRAAGITSADRIFFAFSFGPFIGFWLAFEAGTQMGALCLPGGGLGSAARLDIIIDQAATILCCTPTYAMRLAEVAAREQIDLASAKIRKIIVAGEPGGSVPSTRARIEQLWPGARVVDHHGMTEVGPVTYECPARPGILHVIEPAYLAEVIDANANPAAAGETGELVLTTLGRVGSPLLRYRTGDIVKLAKSQSTLDSEPCACGSFRIALEGGILGRTDDMVIVRGVNVFPSAVEEIVRGFAEIAEYQVQVTAAPTLTELRIQVELASDRIDGAALAARLEKALMAALALRVPVTVVAPGTLPRFESKAKRWIRN